MGIWDCGMGNGEWGFGIAEWFLKPSVTRLQAFTGVYRRFLGAGGMSGRL